MTTEIKTEPTTTTTTTVDEAKLDPAVLAHFADKEKGLVLKREELLRQVSTYKKLIDEVGGEDAIRTLKTAAEKASAEAEAARIASLSKDDLVKETESKYVKLISERDEKITKYQQRMIDKETNAAINEAITAAEGNPKLLANIVRQSVKATLNDDGEVVLEVTGTDGKSTDLSSLITSLRSDNDYAVAFKAPHVSGTGTRKSTDVVSTPDNPWNPASLNMTKQMEMMKQDPTKAAKLAAVHGVKLPV